MTYFCPFDVLFPVIEEGISGSGITSIKSTSSKFECRRSSFTLLSHETNNETRRQSSWTKSGRENGGAYLRPDSTAGSIPGFDKVNHMRSDPSEYSRPFDAKAMSHIQQD